MATPGMTGLKFKRHVWGASLLCTTLGIAASHYLPRSCNKPATAPAASVAPSAMPGSTTIAPEPAKCRPPLLLKATASLIDLNAQSEVALKLASEESLREFTSYDFLFSSNRDLSEAKHVVVVSASGTPDRLAAPIDRTDPVVKEMTGGIWITVTGTTNEGTQVIAVLPSPVTPKTEEAAAPAPVVSRPAQKPAVKPKPAPAPTPEPAPTTTQRKPAFGSQKGI